MEPEAKVSQRIAKEVEEQCLIRLSVRLQEIPRMSMLKTRALLVCAFRVDPDGKLHYVDQTDLVLNNPSPAFAKQLRLQYFPARTGPQRYRFNVYNKCSSKETVGPDDLVGYAEVEGKQLHDDAEVEVQEQLRHDDPNKRQRLINSRLSLRQAGLDRAHRASMDVKRESEFELEPILREDAPADQLRVGVNMMIYGRTFDLHTDGSAVEQALFYRKVPQQPLGMLHWCAPTERDEIPGYSLALRNVTELHVGKHFPTFAQSAAPDRCMSITASVDNNDGSASPIRLDLEAKTDKQRDSWATTIYALLVQNGIPVRLTTSA